MDSAQADTWTSFMDAHSGGGRKLEWGYIFIQAPEDLAREFFQSVLGHDPENVTCPCCGPDYLIEECVSFGDAAESCFGTFGDENHVRQPEPAVKIIHSSAVQEWLNESR